jgi:hypothetical protein
MSLQKGEKIISKKTTIVLVPIDSDTTKVYKKTIPAKIKGTVLKKCKTYFFNSWSKVINSQKDPLIVGEFLFENGIKACAINAPDWQVVEGRKKNE